MLITDLLDFTPLTHRFFAQDRSTFFTHICDLGSVGIAIKAKVVEEDINLKVSIQNFAFILPDVLRTQLHFASADVISILNECRIKHYPANHLLLEPMMVENNLCITTHRK